MGKEILDGDAGSYLIPIKNKDASYSEVALVEPWACVVASYRIKHRDGIKKDGNLLIIGTGLDEIDWQFENLLHKRLPKSITFVNAGPETKEIISQIISARTALSPSKPVEIHDEIVSDTKAVPSLIKTLVEKYSGGKGFDDIIILGDIDTPTITTAADSMCAYGILNYMATSIEPHDVNIDAGKIHYERISFIGSLHNDVNSSYMENLDYSLRGDSVILFGAGGANGPDACTACSGKPQSA